MRRAPTPIRPVTLTKRTTTLAVVLATLVPTLVHANPRCFAREFPVPAEAAEARKANPRAFEFENAWLEKARAVSRNLAAERDPSVYKATGSEAAYGTAVSGTLFVPVLLALFDGTGSIPHSTSDFEEMLFTGPSATGTLAEYYEEISYGTFTVSGLVSAWKNVANGSGYYANQAFGMGQSSRIDEFITEVLDLNDLVIDFGQFDNDGPDGVPNSGDDDGVVDILCIVHEGRGAELTGNPSDLWSHRNSLTNLRGISYQTNDTRFGFPAAKIRVDDYVICPADRNSNGDREGIGVFAHELGHAIGLPDLYDTYDSTSGGGGASGCPVSAGQGIGWWGLMGNGDKNTTDHPAHMCAWSKAQLGWLNPGIVTTDLLSLPLASASTTPTAFRLWKGGVTNSKEYFLVELRTRDGFDQDLAAEGVLIWHVDESMIGAGYGNGNECHPYLDLECADQTGGDHTPNHDDLAADAGGRGDSGDPWAQGTSFWSGSTPSSVSYYGGAASDVRVNVNPDGMGGYEVDLIVGSPASDADLCIRDCTGDACSEPSGCNVWWDSPDIWIDNDGDGAADQPEPGDTNRFYVRVRNLGSDHAEDCYVNLYYSDPMVGGLLPDEAIFVASKHLSMVPGLGETVAQIDAVIPSYSGNVQGYCYVATVDYQGAFAGSDDGKQFNNVALKNSQKFYESAGGPKTGPAPYNSVRDLVVVNRTGSPCDYEMLLGSPPAYADAIVPPTWIYDIAPSTFTLLPNETQTVQLTVSKPDAQDGDFIYLPVTAVCTTTTEVMGGGRMRWEIDNVPPAAGMQFEATLNVEDLLDIILKSALETVPVVVSWTDPGIDVMGQEEEVRAWRVYRGPTPAFVPTDSFLVATVVADDDTASGGFQISLPLATDTAFVWYKLIAVDRAGLLSTAAVTSLVTIVPDEVVGTPAPEAGLAFLRVAPNPSLDASEIALTMTRSAPVRIAVYDVRGRLVRSVCEETLVAGRHTISWDLRDDRSRRVSKGVYFIRADANGQRIVRKTVVLD